MWLDATDADASNNCFINKIRNSAIRMNLSDGVRTIVALLQSGGLEGLDKELISNSAIMRLARAFSRRLEWSVRV